MPNSGTLETVKQFETGWSYAPNGNMTGKDIFDPVSHGLQDSLEYTYGANNHAVTSITSRLTSEEKYAMQYDGVGNMTGQITSPPGLLCLNMITGLTDGQDLPAFVFHYKRTVAYSKRE